MDIKLGRNSNEYGRKEDKHRILIAKIKFETGTREAIIPLRQEQKGAQDIAAAAGSLLYGAGTYDSMQIKEK